MFVGNRAFFWTTSHLPRVGPKIVAVYDFFLSQSVFRPVAPLLEKAFISGRRQTGFLKPVIFWSRFFHGKPVEESMIRVGPFFFLSKTTSMLCRYSTSIRIVDGDVQYDNVQQIIANCSMPGC
jgi:hypothetical protein